MSWLHSVAAATPTKRAASAMTRWHAASPSRASSHEPVDGQRVAVLAAEQVQEGVGAGVRLQAAAVAAPAERPVLVHEHVADLPRGPPGSAVDLPADDEPGADARAEHDVRHLRDAAAGAEDGLRERADVRVVVDVDGQAEARA